MHPKNTRKYGLPCSFGTIRFGFTLAAATISGSAIAAIVQFSDFSDVTSLTLNGSAGKAGAALRLTPEDYYMSGSAFYSAAITLAANTSFSTHFRFGISKPTFGIGDGDGIGADGLVFVVQTVANSVGGAGGGIGYTGIPNSLGIEFDTYNNGAWGGDPDGNHVNFNFGGGFSLSGAVPITKRLNEGQVWNVWIDYNGNTDLLEMRLSESSTRPAAATQSEIVDLPLVLGSQNVFAGFTSGTGAGVGNHDILSWEFRDDYSPIPEPLPFTMFVGLGLAGFVFVRRWIAM